MKNFKNISLNIIFGIIIFLGGVVPTVARAGFLNDNYSCNINSYGGFICYFIVGWSIDPSEMPPNSTLTNIKKAGISTALWNGINYGTNIPLLGTRNSSTGTAVYSIYSTADNALHGSMTGTANCGNGLVWLNSSLWTENSTTGAGCFPLLNISIWLTGDSLVDGSINPTNHNYASDYDSEVVVHWSSTDPQSSCELLTSTYPNLSSFSSVPLGGYQGSIAFNPKIQTKYKVSCTPIYSTASNSSDVAEVDIYPSIDVVVTDPSTGKEKILSGNQATISWSALNSSYCRLDLYPSGVTVASSYGNANYESSGSYITPPMTTTQGYFIYCDDASDTPSSSVGKSFTVYLDTDITVDLNASNPSGSVPNASVTLTWSTFNNPTSCVATGDWSGLKNPSGGSQIITDISGDSNFILNCNNLQGSGSGSVAVNIPPPPVINLTKSQSYPVTYKGSYDISWSAEGAYSCLAYGGPIEGNPGTGITGSFNTGELTTSVNYTVQCDGLGGLSQSSINADVSIPTGSLIGIPCLIGANEDHCLFTFNYFINNGYTTGVDEYGDEISHIKINNLNQAGSSGFFGTGNLFLYYTGVNVTLFDGDFTLAGPTTFRPSCSAGNIWKNFVCVPDTEIINGVCDPETVTPHCLSGTQNTTGMNPWTWVCYGHNGGITVSCPAVTTQCNDSIDNDGDGLKDLADPDCNNNPNYNNEYPECNDSMDNDYDGKMDIDDSDCLNIYDDSEKPSQCNDRVDNDNDGKVDINDSDCENTEDDSEAASQCSDKIDNDGDNWTDFPMDPDCINPRDNTEASTQCSDGIDNDNDGRTDLEDPDCNKNPDDNNEFSVVTECNDGFDNDGDGKYDYIDNPALGTSNDPECNEDPYNLIETVPQCSDGEDNDSDGKFDTDDRDCIDANDNDESAPQCSDGKENDTDGDIDYPDDRQCDNEDDDTEAAPQCNDSVDNDGDKKTDLDDPDCGSNPLGMSEFPPSCNDLIDNDKDGKMDYAGSKDGTMPADPDCSNNPFSNGERIKYKLIFKED